MAVPSHRKVSRKALRQPDEFITTFDWISDWAEHNLTRVIIGAAVLVVVTAIAFLFSFYSQNRQRIASERFYQAITALNDKDYQLAAKGFSTLAEKESGSTLGHLARFYLANTYLALNQPSKASEALRDYLSYNGNPLFRQMALTQLGVANEDLGDYRDAHSAYLEAAQLNGPEKARAQISAARILARLGDRKGAVAAYQQFLRENPFAQQRAEVVEALAQMSAPLEPTVKENGSPPANSTSTANHSH
jgi:predicted negative regulator of RcsB-dependent stress response